MTATAVPAGDRLSFEYHYRDGMPLRPAPERSGAPAWRELRENLYREWIDVGDGWQDTGQTRLLDDHRWQGDEPMDAVVRMFDRMGAAVGRELFERALADGIDALDDPPAELISLFDQLRRRPAWYDAERIERGRRLLCSVTPLAKVGSGVFGIVATAWSKDVSAATGSTGHIVRQPIRRAVESSEFFEKVTYYGALEPDSEIFGMIVRVRLMHSLVRRGLRRRWGDDNFRRHGMPISNTRLAEGSAWFASMPILIDHMLGRRCSMRDLDDVALYWGYILYLFGVEERLIPLNGLDSITLANHIFGDAGEDSPWRVELMDALLKPVGQLPVLGRWALATQVGAGGAVLGVDTMRRAMAGTEGQAIPVRRWRLVYLALARPLAVAASVGDRVPALRRRRARRSDIGDPFLMAGGRAIKALGRRHGIDGTPYTSHDGSTSGTSFDPAVRTSTTKDGNHGAGQPD